VVVALHEDLELLGRRVFELCRRHVLVAIVERLGNEERLGEVEPRVRVLIEGAEPQVVTKVVGVLRA